MSLFEVWVSQLAITGWLARSQAAAFSKQPHDGLINAFYVRPSTEEQRWLAGTDLEECRSGALLPSEVQASQRRHLVQVSGGRLADTCTPLSCSWLTVHSSGGLCLSPTVHSESTPFEYHAGAIRTIEAGSACRRKMGEVYSTLAAIALDQIHLMGHGPLALAIGLR